MTDFYLKKSQDAQPTGLMFWKKGRLPSLNYRWIEKTTMTSPRSSRIIRQVNNLYYFYVSFTSICSLFTRYTSDIYCVRLYWWTISATVISFPWVQYGISHVVSHIVGFRMIKRSHFDVSWIIFTSSKKLVFSSLI